ncbi:MAG: FAD/NAD(P)-binding oxidoreductase [Pyrinomonadaceae bacterium]
MFEIFAEFLIVGGGPAGLSAALAIAENSDRRVLIVDENPQLGGQIWRAELGRIKSPEAARILEKIDRKKIQILNRAFIFAVFDKNTLLAETNRGPAKLKFEKLILSTGGRERFLPFPNWTLPNVFGAGGLQALVKGGFSVTGKRVVVAGSGPLLLAVADFLRSKGAEVLLVAEQAEASSLFRFGIGLWNQPGKLKQAFTLGKNLRGTKILTGAWITEAIGREKLEAVRYRRKNKIREIECDLLACGFHLVPNPEIAALLGCSLENGFVKVSHWQETSVENVFCAGETTGIGGLELALLEGKIAGLSASGQMEIARKFFSERDKLQRFARGLDRAFKLRKELRDLAEAETIVCRCEDVRFGKIKDFRSWRDAKLQTRCGMGACQGRVCGPACQFLFGWENESFRPPVFPVKLESLAGLDII